MIPLRRRLVICGSIVPHYASGSGAAVSTNSTGQRDRARGRSVATLAPRLTSRIRSGYPLALALARISSQSQALGLGLGNGNSGRYNVFARTMAKTPWSHDTPERRPYHETQQEREQEPEEDGEEDDDWTANIRVVALSGGFVAAAYWVVSTFMRPMFKATQHVDNMMSGEDTSNDVDKLRFQMETDIAHELYRPTQRKIVLRQGALVDLKDDDSRDEGS